jgi:hypothetical protein
VNNSMAALIGAVRGPLMLITLGILLLIQRYQDVSIWKTWPVLVILFGLLKLMQRLAQKNPETPAYPGTGLQS